MHSTVWFLPAPLQQSYKGDFPTPVLVTLIGRRSAIKLEATELLRREMAERPTLSKVRGEPWRPRPHDSLDHSQEA